jgi:hypothetical protein
VHTEPNEESNENSAEEYDACLLNNLGTCYLYMREQDSDAKQDEVWM